MKIKVIILASLCIAFSACNLDYDNKNVEEEVVDTMEMIDVATSDHLTFKGVPIDGTLKQFVSRMEQVGFTRCQVERTMTSDDILKAMDDAKRSGISDGTASLCGDFAGYKDCRVSVSTFEGYDVVSKVIVAFPECQTWESLYENYNSLKGMLTEKYGQPTSVKEMFQDKYIDDDQDRIRAARFDKCKYETRFMTEKGEIVLWIDHKSMMSTFVCLQYKDIINSGAVKQQAVNDL